MVVLCHRCLEPTSPDDVGLIMHHPGQSAEQRQETMGAKPSHEVPAQEL